MPLARIQVHKMFLVLGMHSPGTLALGMHPPGALVLGMYPSGTYHWAHSLSAFNAWPDISFSVRAKPDCSFRTVACPSKRRLSLRLYFAPQKSHHQPYVSLCCLCFSIAHIPKLECKLQAGSERAFYCGHQCIHSTQ